MDVGECLDALQGIQEAIEKMRASSNPHRRVILNDIDRQLGAVIVMLCRLLNADNFSEKLGASK